MIHASDRMGGAVIGASILAALVLLPFTQDPSYLFSAVPLAVLIGALGMVLRRLRVNDAVIFLGQLVLLVVYLFAISLPLTEPGQGLFGLFAEGVRHMSTNTAPMVADPGLTVLLVAAVGLSTVLTDLLAVGVDRPAWGILPALTLYLIGAVGLLRNLPWWTIVAVALGYLWILLADGINSAERWPRNLDRRLRLTGRITPLALRMGGIVAAAVVGLTLLVGLLVPLPPAQHWNAGRLDQDTGPIQLADPLLDMRRNLSLPADSPVLTYTTDAGEGQYLRMASLAVFGAAGWQNASFALTEGNALPPAPGQTTPGEEFRTQVQVDDFRSEYLPLPYAPRRFDAPGSWAFNADSLVVVATGEDRTSATREIAYDVVSTDPTPDGAVLSTAMPGQPSDGNITGAVPQDLPQEIVDLTLEITQAEPTAALKAAAIQRFLRSGEFTYSLEPQPGTGYDAMTRFLLEDKRGYCEQFAGSMAAMARVIGIPSRVAVGWLPGEREGEGYEVSMHDMHAWPELYFEGVGWVRFEPTPGVAVPPAWTLTAPEEPTESAAPAPTSQPTETPSIAPTTEPTEAPAEEAEGFDVAALLGRVALALGVLALLAGLLAVPGLLRRRQRSRRLAPSDPEDLASSRRAVDGAWSEVRDSFLDYGHGWPVGSPRSVGRLAAPVLTEEAARSLVQLAREVERSRYAQSARHTGDLAAMVNSIRDGLRADTGWDTRLVGDWWPRSWWAGLGGALSWPSVRRQFDRRWTQWREGRQR